MITELGHLALWLAAALALVQTFAVGVGLARRDPSLIALARPAALAQGVLTALAMAALFHAFATSDFSVKIVAENSHTMKPLLYKYTALWGNHEGSLLLWVTVLAIAGAAIALAPNRLGPRFKARTLQAQGAIALGFYLFLLGVSNPFARLTPAPTEGNGLNPVLQDPGLAFHPPLLYAGYVGLSVAFAFAVAAMLENEVTPRWARAVRPWVLAAWAALTGGIAMGSFWAYYTLGWGGYWFWDPVENASLMPWLAATALLHSVAVLAKRDALRAWTLLLAVAAFSFSMVGTFLVRSGVLTSVHSFAVDPERGLFLLVLLGIYVGGALTLYARRASSVRVGASFEPVSREGALVLNNLILAAILGVVFLGTIYPLLIDLAGATPISVGPPYFQATVGPLVIGLFLLLGVGPFLAWRRGGTKGLSAHAIAPAVAAAAAGLATLLIARDPVPSAVLGFGLAAWVTVSSLAILARHARPGAPVVGMTLAHIGVAVTLVGITAASTQTQELLVSLHEGQTARMGHFEAKLVAVGPAAGANYTALRGRYAILRDGKPLGELMPEVRTFIAPAQDTTSAAIMSLADGDVYITLGQSTPDGGWQTRLSFRPLVTWIWTGGLLIALGGLTAGFARLRARVAVRTGYRASAPGWSPVPAPVPAPAQ
jgi:cytochrome c-type biogenesis protein CcmF